MDLTLQTVDRFEELLQRQDTQGPYDFKSIFRTGGFFVKRASQKKLALLKRLDEPLRSVLRPGERIAFLGTGVLYSLWETYLIGSIVYYLNRRALILTNERLLLIQIDSRRRPQRLKSQILLADIERIGSSPFGNAKVRLRSGASYVFASVPRRDRKHLAELLSSLQRTATRQSETHQLEQLCPYCYAVLPGFPVACTTCGSALKSVKKAALLSLLFPGIGTIYLGYNGLGAFKVVIGAIFWLSAWTPDPRYPMTLGERAVAAVIVLGIVHALAAWASWILARKGHYPAGAPKGAPATVVP